MPPIPPKKMFDHDDSLKFLLAEYEYACSDVQHHTNLHLSAMKFAFSFYTAFMAIVVALYEHFMEAIVLQLAMLLSAGFLIGVMLLFFMIRNRVNFVRAMKQTVALRRFFLDNMEINFKPHNHLYYKPRKVTYFKKISLYTFSMLALITFNTLLAVGSFIMLGKFFYQYRIQDINLLIIFFLALLFFSFQIYIALAYLKSKEKQ